MPTSLGDTIFIYYLFMYLFYPGKSSSEIHLYNSLQLKCEKSVVIIFILHNRKLIGRRTQIFPFVLKQFHLIVNYND